MIKLETKVEEVRPGILDVKMEVVLQNEPTERESMFTDLLYAVVEKLIKTVQSGPNL